jgi:hypothetical protein
VRYVVLVAGVALLVVGGFVVLATRETDTDRVEAQIEARLGPTTEAECAGEDDHWLCDIFDEAIQRDYSGCAVRLDDSGRITSPLDTCRPE